MLRRNFKCSHYSAGNHQNPIVEQLWAARAESKKQHRTSAGISSPYAAFNTPRPPSFSALSIHYPFSTNEFLRETYKSPWGRVRFGSILEDLDACAGNIAFRHCVCEGSWEEPLIVTAGVDRILCRDRPTIEHDMVLSGKISWVGASAMEIVMNVTSQDKSWLEARFTFVSRSSQTNKATNIVPLLVSDSVEERSAFEKGRAAAQRKKELRSALACNSHSYTLDVDKLAKELLAQATPLLTLPTLAPPELILLNQTELQNALIAQPQQRNMHNRIFGGFLMRRAFELAFATAYTFGGVKPNFVEVDDISFLAPVNVGDLILFKSRVLYTSETSRVTSAEVNGDLQAIVEVESFVVSPEKVESKLSNKFHFTFVLPGKISCKKVVPCNLAEARRMAIRMLADKEQREADIKNVLSLSSKEVEKENYEITPEEAAVLPRFSRILSAKPEFLKKK